LYLKSIHFADIYFKIFQNEPDLKSRNQQPTVDYDYSKTLNMLIYKILYC